MPVAISRTRNRNSMQSRASRATTMKAPVSALAIISVSRAFRNTPRQTE